MKASNKPTRRELIARSAQLAVLMAGAGLLPGVVMAAGYQKAAFDAKTIADLSKALGTPAPTESADISLTAPDIAENGAVVPIGISTSLPGVKRMLILVEKNPAVLSAMFDVTESVEPAFSTRVKMGQSSYVYAVAFTGDGKALYTRKEVKVTLGGCGG